MHTSSGRHAFVAPLAAASTILLLMPASGQVTRPIPSIPRAGTAAETAADSRTANILRARRIEEKTQKTPEYSFHTDEERVKPRDWSKIMISYDTAPDWIDELEVRYYVGVKGEYAP